MKLMFAMPRKLDRLPIELLLSIARYLPSQNDINRLVQTSRSIYNCLHFFLCQHNVHHSQGSALLWAAQNGYTELATKMLDAGLEIATFERSSEVAYDKNTTEDLSKANPLLICAETGHIEILKLLLSEKRPNQACSPAQLRTVLHWALRSHQVQVVELMIEHKAPLDPAGDNKEAPSALGAAILSRYNSVIPRLLELGAQPGEYECPCPVERAICTHQPLLVELFLKHRISMSCDQGVCYIASQGNKALLQLLIDYGLDVGVYGRAALLFAIKEGHYDITKLLIDNGASPEFECEIWEGLGNRFFYSAIGYAIHFGRVGILRFLLNEGVLPGESDVKHLDRYSEEILCLLSNISRKRLPRKESLYMFCSFADQYYSNRAEKDPNFKMPTLTCSIDGSIWKEAQREPES